ncbi:MAG: DNA polymerase III subunit gamma/tau [Ruminococcus sp.]|nr:DNA polymerase III subunit gamma/tau [Ruminococcus sp.]
MYKALYRKWRPLTFDDVISQQHITETLKNQIKSGKTAHAYLFTGSRGTGKTTCARILAKAVNCPNMKDGNPCLECDICREAEEGSLTDIIELDAASNNGVDDVRDLRDAAVYSPERCQYKIYIIDEVHMLSNAAFNALLKIMEEPPPYLKFILATTEIHKVPATIASRCQRYDFRRIRQEDMAERLTYIAQQESLDLTPDGAALIAKLADGGMRDAVSLLDQCSVCAEQINAETVSATAGIAGRGYLYDILEAVSEGDTPKALEVTAQLYDMSKDLMRLCEELILQMRNIMLIKASPDTAGSLISCMPDELDRLRALAEKTPLEDVMSRLELLQECRERMSRAMNKRVEFEMALIRLCGNVKASVQNVDNSEIFDKIKQLEGMIGKASSAAAPAPVEKVVTATSPGGSDQPVPNIDLHALKSSDVKTCEQWGEVLEEFRKINPAVASSLEESYAGTAGNVIFITAKNPFFVSLFKIKENALSLGETIYKVLGQKYVIKARSTVNPEKQRSAAEELVKKAINSSIETAVDNNNDQ